MAASDAQEIVDALPDGVIIADERGRVELISAPAVRMLGVEGNPVGQPLEFVLAVIDQDGGGWVAGNLPYDGLATRTAVPEQAWLLPNGEEVLVSAKIHRPALDRPVGRVAVTLRSGRGRARLDRERSDLVATVAHELRSPLTGVKGFVQALLNRWDRLNDDQKKLMLETVSADSDRLARLIAELLDVARIDTGRLQMYPRPVDAGLLIARIVESVAVGTARPINLYLDDRPARGARRPGQVHPGLREPGRERGPARRRHGLGAGDRSHRRGPGRAGGRRGGRGRRGRGHPGRPAPTGVHQVLEGRRPRRLRARALHRRRPDQGARRHGHHRRRTRRGSPDHRGLARRPARRHR